MAQMPDVRIHVDKFDLMIARRGRDVKWQQAILCSCWSDSGQPNYQCLACHGKGYIYDDPVISRALVTSITANKEFEETMGVFDVGDAVMTVPKNVYAPMVGPNGTTTYIYSHPNPMYNIGMYDLVTLLDDEYKTSELVVRGLDWYGKPADTLLNEDVTEIITIRKMDPQTGEVVKFTEGVDFMVNGNKIEWLGVHPNEPNSGEKYSVTYKHRPVYIVLTNLPKPRHQDGQDLPRYVALRYRAGGFNKHELNHDNS